MSARLALLSFARSTSLRAPRAFAWGACAAGVLSVMLSAGTIDARIARIENSVLSPLPRGQFPVAARLEDRMRDLGIPGLSIAVFRDGRVEWTRAYGTADVATNRRVTTSTRFQAASISKPVAAVAALALVERGVLSLDDDVNRYLTSWRVPANGFTTATPVTLRSILTHSAGLTVHGFRGYARGELVPTLVQVLRGERPANSEAVVVHRPVGQRSVYSGGGFSILQLVVEEVTGRSFAEAARELVLDPLGMDQSTFEQPLPAHLRRHAATGYRADGEPVAGGWHTYPEQAAAGLWTTPRDLARFAMELQRIAEGRSRKVLTRELAAEMLRPHRDNWGLGISVNGTGRAATFSHGGANEGFRCYLVGLRNTASGVAIMTNSDTGDVILADLVRAVAREYRWTIGG